MLEHMTLNIRLDYIHYIHIQVVHIYICVSFFKIFFKKYLFQIHNRIVGTRKLIMTGEGKFGPTVNHAEVRCNGLKVADITSYLNCDRNTKDSLLEASVAAEGKRGYIFIVTVTMARKKLDDILSKRFFFF